jgi:hypothetical protein
MTIALPLVDTSVDSLNRQLNLSFEEKLEMFDALAKDTSWAAVTPSIPTAEAATEVMLALKEMAPALTFTFLSVTEKDISFLHAVDKAEWVKEPGIILFCREEQ